MVLSPSAAHSEAVDQTLRVIATGLRLAGPSLMVLIRDAPDHALGELLRWLARQGWDADVAMDPLELVDADPSRVWVLPARAAQATLLNELRPRLRGIRLVLWIGSEEAPLLAEAPDFVDWASHFAACPEPWRTPSFITAGFAAARRSHGRIHWDSSLAPPERPELSSLAELRYWRDLCEQAAAPERAEEPIVRVPPIPFFVRRGTWALIDLDMPAPRVLWSPGAKVYGWWRIHGRTLTLEEAVDQVGADHPKLAALCDGEPERVALAAWLLERGHSSAELVAAALAEAVDAPGAALMERALAEEGVDTTILAGRFGPYGLEPQPGLVDAEGPTPLAHRHLGSSPKWLEGLGNTLAPGPDNVLPVELHDEFIRSFGVGIEEIAHKKGRLPIARALSVLEKSTELSPSLLAGISRRLLPPREELELDPRGEDLSATVESSEESEDSLSFLYWTLDQVVVGLDNAEQFRAFSAQRAEQFAGDVREHIGDEFNSGRIAIEMCQLLRRLFDDNPGEAARPEFIETIEVLEARLLYNCRDNILAAGVQIAVAILVNVHLERWGAAYAWIQRLLAEELLAESPYIQALAGYAATATGDLLIALAHFANALRKETRTARRRQLLADSHQLLARIPVEVSAEEEISAPDIGKIDPSTLLAQLHGNLSAPRIPKLLAHIFAEQLLGSEVD